MGLKDSYLNIVSECAHAGSCRNPLPRHGASAAAGIVIVIAT